MLTDYACERVSADPSGKHHVSQLCSTGCRGSLGCRLAPPLTGEVKEIKWNILNLILPNALWHPHSAETVGVPTQRNSDKTNSASQRESLCHKTCVHHLHWCSLTEVGFFTMLPSINYGECFEWHCCMRFSQTRALDTLGSYSWVMKNVFKSIQRQFNWKYCFLMIHEPVFFYFFFTLHVIVY